MTNPTPPTPAQLLKQGPGARFAAVLRSPDLEDGLAARLADPLWMLARQWQLGEFRGDDAGSLISLNFEASAHMPTWWRPEPDPDQPTARPWQGWTVDDGPLEATVDAEPDDGTTWLRLRIEGGVAARRALCAAGLARVAVQLPAAAPWVTQTTSPSSPLQDPGPLDALAMASTPDAALLDAFIAPWADPNVPMPAPVIARLGLTPADVGTAATTLRTWQAWWRARSHGALAGQETGPVDPPAWDISRLEYRGSLAFASAPGTQLYIDRHPGGPVDWYSADILAGPNPGTPGAPPPPASPAAAKAISASSVPQPARLPGMPALRFWEYEDAEVDFGDIDADPADLARLLLVDYTTVYDHNWYYAPIRIPVGALVEVGATTPVTATDSFGIPLPLQPLAERPGANTRMFTPTGITGAIPSWSTRWFWFAPRMAATLDGDPVERVNLRRDEAANLGWAIIDTTSDSYGRASLATPTPPAPSVNGAAASADSGAALPRYTLRSTLPGSWRALIPTPVGDGSTAYLLVLAQPTPAEPTLGHPPRLLAAPDWAIHEEELGDAGLTLTRTRILGRWYGGGVYTWTGRTAWPGGGEADSGLTWDYLR
jgi:hypothetical protein